MAESPEVRIASLHQALKLAVVALAAAEQNLSARSYSVSAYGSRQSKLDAAVLESIADALIAAEHAGIGVPQ